MGILRLNRRKGGLAVSGINGRAYFQQAAKELRISGLDPVAIQGLARLQSKPGSRKSRVGGHIAWNLQHLSEEETKERAERSEQFLKQEPVVFAAEEATEPR
jgi:hypothetical protein